MVKVKFIYVADQFTRGRSPFCSSAFVFVLAAGVFGRAQLAFENTYLISAYYDLLFHDHLTYLTRCTSHAIYFKTKILFYTLKL